MSKKELSQVALFDRLKRRTITQAEAAKLLRLSVRHVRRKLSQYRKRGLTSLAHALRGKPASSPLG